jgi:drug/metabolite transporter (DMT)-like permease
LTSAVSAAVIMALTPALTALGAAVFLGEKLTGRTIAGTAISVAGALLAVLGANPRGLAGFSLNWGDTLALLAAGCMAFYTIAARRLMRHDVPAITNTAVVIAIGTVFLLPLAIPVLPARLPSTAAPLWGLAGVVLGSTVVAYVAWNKAIDLIGATEPGLIYNFIPVITMLLVSLQGDPPWPAQVIGAGVIIFGVTLAMLPAGLPHRHAPGAQPVH